MENISSQKKNLLEILRAIDFAIYDTVLYLDAYPHCREALEYYHRLIQDREVVVCEYRKKYGPLTSNDNISQTAWQWIDDPWPWEPEAN